MDHLPIPPAVTLAQWEALRTFCVVDDGEMSIATRNSALEVNGSIVFDTSLPLLIAAANDTLPADSQHKITRADIAVLIEAARDQDGESFDEAAARTRALQAKLESLLRLESV